MGDPRSSADALLTEHFRYTPLSLIDEIINTVNAIVYRALNAVETGLLAVPPAALGFGDDDEARRIEVEDGVHRLETLLEATVDRNFDKFEIYALRNILCVPDGLERWMRLEHHKSLTLPLPSSAPTPASIDALRTQLHDSRALGLALEAEAAATQAALAQLRALTAPDQKSLAFLGPTPGATPLATTAQFAASQMPALRTLLAALRPHLAEAAPETMRARARKTLDPASARERRRAYVDGEAERAVRGAVGVLDFGDDGGGLGRGVGEEEVRALEAVAQAVKDGKGEAMEQ